MDIARFNFSHGDPQTHGRAATLLRSLAQSTGRSIALLQDLQGPKVRVANLKKSPRQLERGTTIVLTSNIDDADEDAIPVDQPAICAAARPGDRVLLADGQVGLRVLETDGRNVYSLVVSSGRLENRAGITIPGRDLGLPAITEKDLRDLADGASIGFDFVALSLIRSGDDVQEWRNALNALEWRVPIIAKLERVEALRHLDSILEAADGVMVARGDLGVAVPFRQLPALQKDISTRANQAGRSVVVATEMLLSMVTSDRPTRAEASDVANAIWDGADAVMLSQETSIGDHPVGAVRAMAQICSAAEGHPSYSRQALAWVREAVPSAVAHACSQMAMAAKATAIVALTESGATALEVSKARPQVPVIAASRHPDVLRRTQLYSGVIPLLLSAGFTDADPIGVALRAAVQQRLVRSGDRVVVVAGVPSGSKTNTLTVRTA